jgi:hypothetical protein
MSITTFISDGYSGFRKNKPNRLIPLGMSLLQEILAIFSQKMLGRRHPDRINNGRNESQASSPKSPVSRVEPPASRRGFVHQKECRYFSRRLSLSEAPGRVILMSRGDKESRHASEPKNL